MKIISLRKSRKILRGSYKVFKKKGHSLTEAEHRQFEGDLRALDQAILSKRKEDASMIALRVAQFVKTRFPRTFIDHIKELGSALVFAIVVAYIIHQIWFVLYEVPTGSMRPTIGELDRLVVSKTTFGIKIPFKMRPLFYSDDRLQRNGINTFTVKGMDVPDARTFHFNLIPGVKSFIKRNISKPGDTIYFYGGRYYTVDKEGKGITEGFDQETLEKYGIERIEHIPFMTFSGKSIVSKPVTHNLYASATFRQMNQPVARLNVDRAGKISGEFFNGKGWTEDNVNALKAPHDTPVSYSDLWGMGNYAMARLLTKGETIAFYGTPPLSEDAKLYLELRHTPSVSFPRPTVRRDMLGRFQPMITPFSTIIPLNQHQLDKLQKSIYTSRFVVRDEKGYRYTKGKKRPQRIDFDISLPGVADGTYEFYYGQGYKVHFGGIRTKLSSDNPLYANTPENIQRLFNLGINFHRLFEPTAKNQPFHPQRYAYYRDGDLYLLGNPLLKKTDPKLIRFVKSEQDKQDQSTREAPYIAFVDRGAPVNADGTLDKERIEAFGLKVPEMGTISLGDNYSMSGDSRDFGFVPTKNLRGAPSVTFWPPGARIGTPPQPPYPWVTLPNFLSWGTITLVLLICWYWCHRRNQHSIFKD